MTTACAKAFDVGYHLDDATLAKQKQYGVHLDETTGTPLHELPVPSVFIIDATGIIRYVYSNPDYTVRLASDALLVAAQPMRRGAPRRNRRSQYQTDFRSNLCLPRQSWRAWVRSATWAGACSVSMSPMISMGPWCLTAIGVQHAGGGRRLAGKPDARRVGHCRREP